MVYECQQLNRDLSQIAVYLQGDDISTWEKYTFSLFRSMAQMIGMGYSIHAPPTTLPEVWVAMISYILGGIFYALFIAHMSTLILNWNLPGKKYEQKVWKRAQHLLILAVFNLAVKTGWHCEDKHNYVTKADYRHVWYWFIAGACNTEGKVNFRLLNRVAVGGSSRVHEIQKGAGGVTAARLELLRSHVPRKIFWWTRYSLWTEYVTHSTPSKSAFE